MELKKYKKKRIVPQGWKEITLGEVFRTSSGATPLSTETSYYENGTIPWINSGELDSPYIYGTTNFISQKGFENSSTEIYPIDSVLVAMYGATAGKASLLKMEACTNQAVCAILPDKKYSSSFLKYSIDTLYDHLVGLSSGSARDNLSQTEIKKLRLIMPQTKEEQDKLVSILALIDRKIELNRAINQNLEAMAKQLYDYWFVQFDFPNEDGKPYKSSGGEMVWNEKLKRDIPKGWEIRPLNSLIPVKDGTHESPKQQLEGRYLITSKHLLSSGIDYNTAYYISEEDYIAINKRSQVETNDILFSMIGTIGNKYLVAEKNINFAIKNMALLKTSKSMHIMYFLWLYLSSWDYKHYEFNAISGSIQKFLSLDAMRNIPIPFNYDIAVAFNKQVSIICQCIINVKEENIQLIKQRNELLPLLMTGKVSVNSDLSAH